MLICFCFSIEGIAGLIAILFFPSRERYSHAYDTQAMDYVISRRLWVFLEIRATYCIVNITLFEFMLLKLLQKDFNW